MMSGIKNIDEDIVINICPDNSEGDIISISNLDIQIPSKPPKSKILFYNKKKEDQKWERQELPDELKKIKSMDEWLDMPDVFRNKYHNYITQEYERRRKGIWFYNTQASYPSNVIYSYISKPV
jgi:hypothetical protein